MAQDDKDTSETRQAGPVAPAAAPKSTFAPDLNATEDEVKAADTPTLPATASPESTAIPRGDSKPGHREQTDHAPMVPFTEEQQAAMHTINRDTEARMDELRSECKAMSDALVREIAKELTSNDEATGKSVQVKFLGKLLNAERDCDSRFESLLADAREAYEREGIPVSELPDWPGRYRLEKATARAAAIARLASAAGE